MTIFWVSRGFAQDFHNFSRRYAWNSHRYPTEYPDHLVCLILLLRYNQWSSRSVSGDFCLIFDFLSVRIIRTESLRRILNQQSSESDSWRAQVWLGGMIDDIWRCWMLWYWAILRWQKDMTIWNVRISRILSLASVRRRPGVAESPLETQKIVTFQSRKNSMPFLKTSRNSKLHKSYTFHLKTICLSIE